MKRNVISLLLAVVMVFAITAVVTLTAEPVAAAAPAAPTHHVHTEHDSTWTPITAETTLEDGGKYYYNWTSGNGAKLTVAENANVVICMNGKTHKVREPIVPAAGATVTICDCSKEQTGMLAVTSTNGLNKTYSAVLPVTVDGYTVNLMSGSITSLGNAGVQYSAVAVTAGTFNMYGGSINDGAGAPTKALVRVEGGTFNMCGGTIEDSENATVSTVTVSGGEFNMSGGSITGSAAANTAPMVSVTGGEFELSGTGLITGGNRSDNHGGNVYVNEGNFTMSGGSITDGKATGSSRHGGNVWLSKGTFTMSGGTISGGSATAKGGNVVMTGGTFNMSNGTISGGQAGTLGGNVSLNTAATFNMTGGTITGGWSTTTAADEGGGNVHVYGATSLFNMSNGTISDGGVYTVGGTETFMTYGGNIYLESGAVAISGGTVSGGRVDATAGLGGNIYVEAGSCSVTGTATIDGTDVGTGNFNASKGGNAYVAGGTLAIGTENGADAPAFTLGKAKFGGSIFVAAEATVNMYRGSIADGIASSGGGNVRLDGAAAVFNLKGGSVTGGNCVSGGGGNFSITGKAVFTMTGGSVSGGQANGGSGDGANLFLASACTVTVTGGEVGAYTNAVSGVRLNNDSAVFTVGGTAKVTDVALGTTGRKIAISTETPLTSGAAISVTAPEGTVIAETDEDCSKYFDCTTDGLGVTHNGTRLVIAAVVVTHNHCWCVDSETVGHSEDCENAVWTEATVSSNKITFTVEGQHLYLTEQKTASIAFADGVTTGYLCLNGNNLRAQTPINLPEGKTLYVCDCQNTGKIISTQNNGRVVVNEGGTLTMVGVTVDGENAKKPLDLRGASTTKLYDCDLLNGKRTGDATAQGYGDSVFMQGTAQLDAVNCKFQLASDTSAKGNIYADDGTTLTLTDCTVSGGTDLFLVHGNLTLDGTTNLTGATDRHIVLYQNAAALTLGSSFAPAGDQVWDVIKAAPADATEAEKYAFATGASDSNKDLFRAVGEGGDYITSYEAGTVYLIPSACRIDDVGYASLAEALEDYDPAGQAIKLNDDCNETSLTLTKNVVIDLNGYDITNAITDSGYTLSIYDYANYQYDADACGSYAGDNAEKYVVVDETMSGAATLRRYIALDNGDGTWSFHRVYVTISAVSINPTADVTSLNYSTVFIGDQAVADYINSNNGEYGLKAEINGYEPVYRAYEAGSFKACTTDLVNNTSAFTEKQTAIGYIMKSDLVEPSDLNDLNNSERAALEVQATAYIKLTIDGEEITVESSNQAATARSFQGMVNTAAAAWDSLLPAQKTALWSLKETFGSELTTDNGWVVDKIVDPEEETV